MGFVAFGGDSIIQSHMTQAMSCHGVPVSGLKVVSENIKFSMWCSWDVKRDRKDTSGSPGVPGCRVHVFFCGLIQRTLWKVPGLKLLSRIPMDSQ